MKKILAILGSLTLLASSTTAVVACSNEKTTTKTDNELYDQSANVQKITTNGLARFKSVILADQFGLSDNANWSAITSYNPKDEFTTLFDADSVNSAQKVNLNLEGMGGESNILLKEGINSIFNALGGIAIPGVGNVGDLIKGALKDVDINQYLDSFADVITYLPKGLVDQPLNDIMGMVSLGIQIIFPLIGGLLPIDDNILNIAADGISSVIRSALREYKINDLVNTLVEATAVDTYKDMTFEDLSTSLWMSLLTTIAYGVNSNYVSNPTQEVNPNYDPTKPADGSGETFSSAKVAPLYNEEDETNDDTLIRGANNNATRVFKKFNDFVIKGGKTDPIHGEETEFLGVVKYAIKTIKILEIYLQFHGEEFFTYIPDTNDWNETNGNDHLFSKTQTNGEYFIALNKKKVSEVTQLQDGLNFKYLWKVFKTFLANDNAIEQEHGVMFQKFINALLTQYYTDGLWILKTNRFRVPVWDDIFINIIDDYIPGALKFFIPKINRMIEQIFRALLINEPLSDGEISELTGLINLALGVAGSQIPADILPIVKEVADFLSSVDGKTKFLKRGFDYLWKEDLTTIVPSQLEPIKTRLNIDKLNLKNLVYNTSLVNLFKMFNVDLTKYGDEFTSKSIAGFIQRMDEYIKIDEISYADINNENLDLKQLQKLLSILAYKNPIELSDDEDNEKTDGDIPKDQSLIRQLISNIKNPVVIEKILGFVIKDDQTVDIVQDSFMGTILKFVYPQMTGSADNAYTTDDLAKTIGFNGNLIKALGNLLTSLLKGNDYTYLIAPLVSNKDIWKITKTTNTYFADSNGQLKYQQFFVQFDPTGVKLEDGSVVDDTHKATYVLTFRRTSQLGQFKFSRMQKQFSK